MARPRKAILDRIQDEFRHDPETGELFRRVGTLSVSKTGYERLNVSIDGQLFLVAHVIWFLEHGEWPKHMLDHINQDSCDNRPENLREITHGGNLANSKHRKRPLPTGVYIKRGRFQARINNKGILVVLGSFNTPEEAEKAFIAAHLQRFGEHSRYFEGKRQQRFSSELSAIDREKIS
jgi:hypothetical protein